jgi:phosphate transport system substrate-binding protein
MVPSGRVASVLLLVILLATCGEPLATPEPVYLRAAGSTAMSPLVADLATAFHAQSPTVNIEVIGLGTEFGLESLRAGEADMAMASWLPPDLPGLRTTALARDGIAVIVHPENPVDGLGLLQLQDLFDGRISTWEGVGGQAKEGEVQPVSREEGSGTRAAFEAMVMEERRVTPVAVMVSSSQAVIDYVAQHPGAIGYVSMGFVSPEVKAIKIEGELPTPQSAERGSYPLTHELWLVTADRPAEAIQRFLNFAQSPAGQQIIGRHYGRIKSYP